MDVREVEGIGDPIESHVISLDSPVRDDGDLLFLLGFSIPLSLFLSPSQFLS